MNNRIALYAGIMLVGVAVSSFSQVLLKKASQKTYASRIREYLNLRVIVAYFLFFSATLCTVFAYRVIPVSMGPVIEASGYLFVTLFGYIFFHETVTGKKVLALTLIIAGICIFAIF